MNEEFYLIVSLRDSKPVSGIRYIKSIKTSIRPKDIDVMILADILSKKNKHPLVRVDLISTKDGLLYSFDKEGNEIGTVITIS